MKYFVEVVRRHRTTALEEYLAEFVMKTFNGALVTKAQAEKIPTVIADHMDTLRRAHPNWACGDISTTGFGRRKSADEAYRLVDGAPNATVYIPAGVGVVSKSFLLTIRPVIHNYSENISDKYI